MYDNIKLSNVYEAFNHEGPNERIRIKLGENARTFSYDLSICMISMDLGSFFV